MGCKTDRYCFLVARRIEIFLWAARLIEILLWAARLIETLLWATRQIGILWCMIGVVVSSYFKVLFGWRYRSFFCIMANIHWYQSKLSTVFETPFSVRKYKYIALYVNQQL